MHLSEFLCIFRLRKYRLLSIAFLLFALMVTSACSKKSNNQPQLVDKTFSINLSSELIETNQVVLSKSNFRLKAVSNGVTYDVEIESIDLESGLLSGSIKNAEEAATNFVFIYILDDIEIAESTVLNFVEVDNVLSKAETDEITLHFIDDDGDGYSNFIEIDYGTELTLVTDFPIDITTDVLPPLPSNVRGNPLDQTVKLSWDSQSQHVSFSLFYSKQQQAVESLDKSRLIAHENISSPFLIPEVLENGDEYHFYIIAINDAGESVAHVSATPKLPSLPTSPSDISVNHSNTHISWSAVDNARAYDIIFSPSEISLSDLSEDSVQRVTVINNSVMIPSSLQNNTQFYYVVIAKNNSGESALSDQGNFFMEQGVPQAVENISIAPISYSAQVSWNVSDNVKYKIYLTENAALNSENYQSLEGVQVFDRINSTFSFPDNLSPLITYYLLLAAYNDTAETVGPSVLNFKPLIAAPVIEAQALNRNIKMNWQEIPGATDYIIYMAQDEELSTENYSNLAGGMIHRYEAPKNEFIHPSPLVNGVDYFFLVTVKMQELESPTSPLVRISPELAAPPAPDNVEVKAEISSLLVSWTPSTTAEFYTVYVAQDVGVTTENYSTLSGGVKHSNITAPHYLFESLDPNVMYYVIVTASNTKGESISSSIGQGLPEPPVLVDQSYVGISYPAVIETRSENTEDQAYELNLTQVTANVTQPPVQVLTQNPEQGQILEGASVDITISIPPDPNVFLTLPHAPKADVDTTAYYKAVDPQNERDTLEKWLVKNQFVGDEGYEQPDAEVLFYNTIDHDFARRIFLRRNGEQIAFYGDHYGNLLDGSNETNVIESVAIELSPAPDGSEPNHNYVKYFAYGPDGKRVDSVDLDGRGPQPLPNLCIVCHGGHAQEVEEGVYPNQGNVHSRLIPFDIDTFEFDESSQLFNRITQEGAFRKMNQAVIDSLSGLDEPIPAAIELVEGWYNNTKPLAGKYDGSFVPSGWHVDNVGEAAQELYSTVIAESCRTCHLQRSGDPGGRGFSNFEEFKSLIPLIERRVFFEGAMPRALPTYNNFWLSTLPHQPSILAKFLPNVDGSKGPGYPIAKAGGVIVGEIGQSSNLNAGNSLFSSRFNWEIISAPDNSVYKSGQVLASTSLTTLTPDLGGDYEIQLTTANDEVEETSSDIVTIAVRPINFASDIYERILKPECESCHANGGGAPEWFKADPIQTLVYLSQATPELVQGAYLNLETPESSLLLQQPTGVNNHLVALGFDGAASNESYQTMLRWLQEGAALSQDPLEAELKIEDTSIDFSWSGTEEETYNLYFSEVEFGLDDYGSKSGIQKFENLSSETSIDELDPNTRYFYFFTKNTLFGEEPVSPILDIVVPGDVTENYLGLTLQEATENYNLSFDKSVYNFAINDLVPSLNIPAVEVLNQVPLQNEKISVPNLQVDVSIPLDNNEFLTLSSASEPGAASQYYNAIDPNNQKTNLNDWLTENNFLDSNGSLQFEEKVKFYNDNTLGFWRELYMNRSDGDLAFFGQHQALSNLSAESSEIKDTVAIELSANENNPEIPFVKFYAFDDIGERVTEIALDARGVKSVPDLCISCHGGQQQYLQEGIFPNGGNVGASLIPFDLDSFLFDDNAETSREAQEDAFRQFNQAVLDSKLVSTTSTDIETTNSDSLPIPNPDDGLTNRDVCLLEDSQGETFSEITFSGLDGYINDFTISIDSLQHSNISDLVISLTSPLGAKRIVLMGQEGDGVTNINQLSFNAIAEQHLSDLPISNESITGLVQSIGDLSELNGLDPNGVWRLTIEDKTCENNGELTGWSIQLKLASSNSVELIKGWYGNSNPLVGNFDGSYTPKGWQNETDVTVEALYHDVVKPVCMTCHLQKPGNKSNIGFDHYAQFYALLPDIEKSVYQNGSMPGSLHAFEKFWISNTPYQPEILAQLITNEAGSEGPGRAFARISGPTRGEVGKEKSFNSKNSVFSNHYEWSLVAVPAGSNLPVESVIVDFSYETPSYVSSYKFTPDREGQYTLQLISSLRSAESESVISSSPPQLFVFSASPGLPKGEIEFYSDDVVIDSIGIVDSPVTLSGFNSSSAKTYQWHMQSAPIDSQYSTDELLLTSTDPTFVFTPDVDGVYEFQLTVFNSEGKAGSPVNKTFNVEPIPTIDGPSEITANKDVDFSCQNCAYSENIEWLLETAPESSSFTPGILDFADVNGGLLFTPDIKGVFEFTVTINILRETIVLPISLTVHEAPEAIIVGPVEATVGDNVEFNGDTSVNAINYRWEVTAVPEGSNYLNDILLNESLYRMTPDLDGSYIITLKVTNPLGDESAAAIHNIVVQGIPIANIGGPTDITEGKTASFNCENCGDFVDSHQWTVTSVPVDSTLSGMVGNDTTFELIPDFVGDYTISLITRNSLEVQSSEAQYVLTAHGAGIANITGPTEGTVDESFVFNGDSSINAAGFQWLLSSVPAASQYNDIGLGGIGNELTVVPDVPGDYSVSLLVRNDLSDESETVYYNFSVQGKPVASIDGPLDITQGKNAEFSCLECEYADTYEWSVESAPGDSELAGVIGQESGFNFIPDAAGIYNLSLIVKNSLGFESTKATHSLTAQIAPKAVINGDSSITVSDDIILDGGNSVNATTYQWEVIATPPNSNQMGSNSTESTFTVTPDFVGVYTISLVAVNSLGDSSVLETHNVTALAIPVADISGPSSGTVNDDLIFDGAGSSDATTYHWLVTNAPNGSDQTGWSESGSNSLFTVTPDVLGDYTVSLTVSNSLDFDSPAVQREITVAGKPNAVIEGPTEVAAANRVDFIGSNSEHAVRYEWQVSVPASSSLYFPISTDPDIFFTPDVEGSYGIQLTVWNDENAQHTDNIILNVGVGDPLALISGDETGIAEQEFNLSAATSSFANTFQWKLTAIPELSSQTVGDVLGSETNLVFIPDVEGDYSIELIVFNSEFTASVPNTIDFTIDPGAPTASIAGPYEITEDKKATFNCDNCAFSDSIEWVLESVPTGSALVSGTLGTTESIPFTPDISGEFGISVTVKNSLLANAVANHTLTSHGSPVAKIVGSRTATANLDTVVLDGTSSDNPKTYQWIVSDKPVDSEITLLNGSESTFNISPDVPGPYEIELVVTNAIDDLSLVKKHTIDVEGKPVAVISLTSSDTSAGTPKTFSAVNSQYANATEIPKYEWKMSNAEAGSNYSDGQDLGNNPNISITPDIEGSYTVQLTVWNSLNSRSETVYRPITVGVGNPVASITITDDPPVGVAIEPVSLSASGSDYAESYAWSLTSVPSGSVFNVNDSIGTAENIQFTPDIEGNYGIQLVVSNSTFTSSPDEIILPVDPGIPTVNISGLMQITLPNNFVNLTCDDCQFAKTYRWQVNAPADSKWADYDNTSTNSSLNIDPDISGNYTVSLITINSISQESDIDEHTLTAYDPAVAVITGTTLSTVDSPVSFIGDDNDTANIFRWAVIEAPNGASDENKTQNSLDSSFTINPNIIGTYTIELQVENSIGDLGSVDTHTIEVQSKPIAIITGENEVTVGNPKELTWDGATGTNSLYFEWEVTAVPSGSGLLNTTGNQPTFAMQPDIPGDYILSLTTKNSDLVPSQAVNFPITAFSVPTASITGDNDITTGPSYGITLDGSDSLDEWSYEWSLISNAPGSGIETGVVLSTENTFTFHPDSSGVYRVQLITFNFLGDPSLAETHDVTGVSPPSATISGNTSGRVRPTTHILSAINTDSVSRYSWSVVSEPSGSSPTIVDANNSSITFSGNLSGSYRIRMRIFNRLDAFVDVFHDFTLSYTYSWASQIFPIFSYALTTSTSNGVGTSCVSCHSDSSGYTVPWYSSSVYTTWYRITRNQTLSIYRSPTTYNVDFTSYVQDNASSSLILTKPAESQEVAHSGGQRYGFGYGSSTYSNRLLRWIQEGAPYN